jgi:hypothetical protein
MRTSILFDGDIKNEEFQIYTRSMGTDSELIYDEDGRDRGSFTSEWILSYRPGRIDGEWVVFSPRSICSYEPEASLSLLRDFVQLADGNGRVIQRFAAKHGALGLCEEHSLPAHHRSGNGRCEERRRPGDDVRESLRSWLRYAARARAILNLASAVIAGRDGDYGEWRVLGTRSMLGRRRSMIPKPGNREYQKQYLAHEVRTWLNECRAQPAITWEKATPIFRLRAETLLGVIGIALMSAILKSGGIMACSACGLLYTPKRKPAASKNHYCEKCGKGQRAAKRMWARKQRDPNRLFR